MGIKLSPSAVHSGAALASLLCAGKFKVGYFLDSLRMPSPTEEIFQEIAKDFNIRWNFPNCVGSIDGKHIRIKCPPNTGSQCFYYKPYHSIVLQDVVDADFKFVTVDVGAFGKQSDGGVFRYSTLHQSFETRSLKLPEDTVLPNGEITLPWYWYWYLFTFHKSLQKMWK